MSASVDGKLSLHHVIPNGNGKYAIIGQKIGFCRAGQKITPSYIDYWYFQGKVL
jgi:hypothetical protein